MQLTVIIEHCHGMYIYNGYG